MQVRVLPSPLNMGSTPIRLLRLGKENEFDSHILAVKEYGVSERRLF